MEKKTKLQLKKETVAVLNGQNMNNVIGGVGGYGDKCAQQEMCPVGYVCVNQDNGEGICVQENISLTITISPVTPTLPPTDLPTNKANTCLTCKPGVQNTCGLCNP